MTHIEIIEKILTDNRELEKSTRFYNQTAKQRAKAIARQRSELKLLNIPHVVEPKETFICTICDEEMEVGEQCGYEEMSCPSYVGK